MPKIADCIIEVVIAVAISFTASKIKGMPFSLMTSLELLQTASFFLKIHVQPKLSAQRKKTVIHFRHTVPCSHISTQRHAIWHSDKQSFSYHIRQYLFHSPFMKIIQYFARKHKEQIIYKISNRRKNQCRDRCSWPAGRLFAGQRLHRDLVH